MNEGVVVPHADLATRPAPHSLHKATKKYQLDFTSMKCTIGRAYIGHLLLVTRSLPDEPVSKTSSTTCFAHFRKCLYNTYCGNSLIVLSSPSIHKDEQHTTSTTLIRIILHIWHPVVSDIVHLLHELLHPLFHVPFRPICKHRGWILKNITGAPPP
jgi:hypothetical protein